MTRELDLDLPYKVAAIDLAEFGRKEMQLSEKEMPGLMECIRKYGSEKPLAGKKITGSLLALTSAGPPAIFSPPRIMRQPP